MKNLYPFLLVLFCGQLLAQPATVSNPLAIGQNCGGGGSNFKSFTYDSASKILAQLGPDCFPDLASPGFNPGGGSIAFSPKDQKVYYIETTTGNNSIVWDWTPGVCPTGSQVPVYTYSNTFIVGLEFNTITGDGYQLEFSTGSAPYDIFLRKVTSFGPPLVAGPVQQILLPAGKNIWQQNGDIVITPTGKMYFILDNKMFNLDYSSYGTGTLNATYIDSLQNGPGNNVIGLAYTGGHFVASVLGGSCSYSQIDVTPSGAVAHPVNLGSGSFVSYDMATLITGIGAAKTISSVSITGTNFYQVAYDIKVKNYGNVNLASVQLTDSVATVFGTSFVSASAGPVGSLPAGLTLNPFFDGTTDAHIFSAGSNMVASPADSAIIRVTVNLNSPDPAFTYLNSAIASATGTIYANNVRDSSDNQMTLDPDVSGTDVPDITGEGVPTPLNLFSYLLLANKIINFNGHPDGAFNDLSWILDNQVAGSKSILQRSADGIHFDNLTTVDYKTGPKQPYDYTDKHPLANNNYYRLKLNEFYSGIVLIRKQEKPLTIVASPNPFNGSLHFSLTLPCTAIVQYKVLDLVSTQVLSGQCNAHAGPNQVTIYNAGSLPAGTYILQVTTGGKQYFTKIIRSR
jgi:uncharacterized repeat protein (TIGR01451 family)